MSQAGVTREVIVKSLGFEATTSDGVAAPLLVLASGPNRVNTAALGADSGR